MSPLPDILKSHVRPVPAMRRASACTARHSSNPPAFLANPNR